MGAAIFGLLLWFLTDNPNLAILFALTADLFAALPTVIKSYKHPETESWIAYAISTVGFGISILSIHNWTFQDSAFVIYLFLIQLVLTLLVMRRLRRPKKKIA